MMIPNYLLLRLLQQNGIIFSMLVLLTPKLADKAGFFIEVVALLQVHRIKNDDPIVASLQERGFSCSALLYSIKFEEKGGIPLEALFLNSEIKSLQDLIRIVATLNIIPFQSSESLRDVITMAPLFRTALEGFFKVDYVFCIQQMGATREWKDLHGRFLKIVDICKKEYNRFVENRASYLGVNLGVLDDAGNKFNVERIVNDTHKESADPREDLMDKVAYSAYSLCSFYTHGNMNKGLLKAANIEEFVTPDFDFLMEAISLSYLKYFVSLIGRVGSLSNIIQEIHDAENQSSFLESVDL